MTDREVYTELLPFGHMPEFSIGDFLVHLEIPDKTLCSWGIVTGERRGDFCWPDGKTLDAVLIDLSHPEKPIINITQLAKAGKLSGPLAAYLNNLRSMI